MTTASYSVRIASAGIVSPTKYLELLASEVRKHLLTDQPLSESRRLLFYGYPPATRLIKLRLQEGRWPRDDESGAIVVNRLVQSAAPGSELDREITLKFRDRRVKVRVVGVVEEIGAPTIYSSFSTFEAVTGLGDASQVIRVKAAAGHEQAVANALDQALLDAHLAPSTVSTRHEFRTALDEHFAVVTAVMKMVALAAALIGAISLVASVSLSVLERAREIGVIRALGATPRAVVSIFLIEGSAVAILGALISIAASIYFAQALNGKASRELLHVEPAQIRAPQKAVVLIHGGVGFH